MIKENDNKIIYQSETGALELKTDYQSETVWASQKDIANIFNIDRTVVNRHINNIFKDGELDEKGVCAIFAHTTKHGSLNDKNQTRNLKFYSLDIILAVGYRTNSSKAINFRKWATQTLKQHITQGYTINQSRVEHDPNLLVDVISKLQNKAHSKGDNDDT
jgi:hypothetical protein